MRKIVTLALIMWLFMGLLSIDVVQAQNTPVTEVGVFLRDYVVTRPVDYVIRFKTPHTLQGGQDTVTIKFPEEMTISSSISRGNVSINNFTSGGIDYRDGVLMVLIPEAINILGGELVEVSVASGAVSNPSEAGNYRVTVKTSQDTLEVESASFYITDYEYPNGVSKPSVRVGVTDDNSAEYTIKFKTSVNGELNPGSFIYLTFPVGTEMPSSIERSEITINGSQLFYSPTIENRKLTLVLPSLTVPPAGTVEIVISPEARIKKPSTAGYNTIKVATSIETREVTSFEFEVVQYTSQQTVTRKGLDVIASPNGRGQTAAYTITIRPGLLSTLSHTVNNLVLAFPPGTALPESIPTEKVRVNGATAAGSLVNKYNNELIIVFPQSYTSDTQISISIDQTAGIKNPGIAQHKIDVGMIRQTKTILSDWFEIIEAGSQVITPPPATTPPSSSTVTEGSDSILLRIDSNLAHVNGELMVLDSPATLIDNVAMVPLRFVANCLGAETEYDALTSSVTVKLGNKEILLWVDSSMAKVNGVFISMNAEVKNINNRLMVPVRFVSENLGTQVSWDSSTSLITITKGTSTSVNSSIPTDNYPIGYRLYIKSENSYVNLRTGPGTFYQLAGRLQQGETATILEVEGDWYKVRLSNGMEAYIANWVVNVPRTG